MSAHRQGVMALAPVHLGRRRWRSGQGPAPLSATVALLAVAWSAAVLYQRILGATLPGPARLGTALPFLMPAMLVGLLFVSGWPASRLDEAVAVWVTMVVLAVSLLPSLRDGSLTPFAIPAAFAAAVPARRWPAVAMLLVLAFSASFGSLHAFWNFPVEKAIALVLAGLWVASLTGLVFRGSRRVRLSVPLAIFGAYLLITALQIPLATNRSVAELGFKDGGWFMLVTLLIAYAGWGPGIHERIARAIVVVAAVAGAYALYRVIVGPAAAEFRLFAGTQFNFVNGKLKPGGSFGSAQDMGIWMAAVVPFSFAAMLTGRGRWRALAGVACALCTVAAIESQLRIALVAIIVSLLLIIVLCQVGRGLPGPRLGMMAAALLVGAALLVAGLAVTGNDSAHSFKALLHPTSDPSYVARRYKWSQALKDLETRPFGYGLGTASFGGQQSGGAFVASLDTSVDNGFLKIALEQGLVIMIIFAAALVAVLLALIRCAAGETERRRAGIAIGAAGTVASFLIVMMAVDATANPRSLATWVIAGLGMAVAVTRTRGPANATAEGL